MQRPRFFLATGVFTAPYKGIHFTVPATTLNWQDFRPDKEMALQKLIFSFIFLFSTEFISSFVVQPNDVLQKGHLTLQNIQVKLFFFV